jgi:hypothetical protein
LIQETRNINKKGIFELKKTFNKNLPKPEGQEKSQIKSQALIGDGIMIW